LKFFGAGNYGTRKCDRGEQNADGEAAAKTGLEAIQPVCDPGSILDFRFRAIGRGKPSLSARKVRSVRSRDFNNTNEQKIAEKSPSPQFQNPQLVLPRL